MVHLNLTLMYHLILLVIVILSLFQCMHCVRDLLIGETSVVFLILIYCHSHPQVQAFALCSRDTFIIGSRGITVETASKYFEVATCFWSGWKRENSPCVQWSHSAEGVCKRSALFWALGWFQLASWLESWAWKGTDPQYHSPSVLLLYEALTHIHICHCHVCHYRYWILLGKVY